MIITFCGHSKIYGEQEELQRKVLSAIEEAAEGKDVTFYLGGYGSFDSIALCAAKRYKEEHPASRLLFILPYFGKEYFASKETYIKKCDDTLYPELEKTPKRLAISKRNEWMIKSADYVIAYVDHSWGGAAKALLFAHKRKTPYRNLGNKVFD